MVGVPRSRGCSTCVRRRVKCDEAKPACFKCQIYGAECPGYERSFKFVDRVHRRPQPSYSKSEGVEKGSNVRSVDPKLSPTNMAVLSPYRGSGISIVATIQSPNVYHAQCLSTWIEDVSRSQSSVPDEVTIARLFCFIPTRLGSSKALELAVNCLTVHHFGITKDDEDIIRHGWFTYGRALSSLQKAVYDPVEAIKSETICAIMILSIYELFACTKADSWMKHADGVSKLLQLRGPKSFQNDFDSAMMMAFKGLIIMEALFSGKPCFLDLEEWRYLSLQPPNDSFSALFYEKTDEFTRCIAACPWLVKEAYSLRSANRSDVSTLVRVAALVHRTLEIHGHLQRWYEEFTSFAPLPDEVPSSTQDRLYPVVYSYHSPSIATTFCGYYAATIILHRILIECHHPAGCTREISSTVENVCKSVEYLAATGTLGPYRVGFSLRVAFEFATVTTKLWIRGWLTQFERIYKACSPSNYPPIEVADDETTIPTQP